MPGILNYNMVLQVQEWIQDFLRGWGANQWGGVEEGPELVRI